MPAPGGCACSGGVCLLPGGEVPGARGVCSGGVLGPSGAVCSGVGGGVVSAPRGLPGPGGVVSQHTLR